jgi:hypothetical protein
VTLPCSQLDDFCDGELAAAEAAAFRTHLATCNRCQRQLSGRMQEAMVVEEGAEVARVIPIARARPRPRSKTRAIAIAGAAVAVAAAAMLVWTWPRTTPTRPQLAVAFTIERGAAVVRDASPTTAHPGDVVHVHATGTVWIYRDDHELVLACPGDRGCRAGGADFPVSTIGSYTIVVVGGDHLPTPHGNLDTDVASVSGSYKMLPLTVD